MCSNFNVRKIRGRKMGGFLGLWRHFDTFAAVVGVGVGVGKGLQAFG
jgi:hypothetical protein